jgi:hypothetical protein
MLHGSSPVTLDRINRNITDGNTQAIDVKKSEEKRTQEKAHSFYLRLLHWHACLGPGRV